MNIQKEIENLIIKDLKSRKPSDEQHIWKYRDKYFLSGQYDYLFIRYIADNNIK